MRVIENTEYATHKAPRLLFLLRKIAFEGPGHQTSCGFVLQAFDSAALKTLSPRARLRQARICAPRATSLSVTGPTSRVRPKWTGPGRFVAFWAQRTNSAARGLFYKPRDGRLS